jgi:hypothetical protein
MEIIRTQFPSMDPWETSVRPALTLLPRLMAFLFLAGAGKSVLWYVNHSRIPS